MTDHIYLGYQTDGTTVTREIFRAGSTPTFTSHGGRFAAVVGPFRTMRGAQFMRDYGQGNPHCQTVDDAERLGRRYATTGGRDDALSA